MSRAVMQQALEALETCSDTSINTGEDFVMTHVYDEDKVAQALVTLRAALAKPEQEPIGAEWQACTKLPVTVHVRAQRPGETHVSTREGITPVKPDDLIMRGVSGEEYPIGRQIFEQTYRMGEAAPTPRKKPLTEEERVDLVKSWGFPKYSAEYYDAIGVTHSVEAAHGIGDSNAALRERLGEGE